VRLHLGTAEVGARVVARGGPVRPGSTVAVRLVLEEPLVARGGDRFVLRSASPATTIGGGIITDPHPPFRRTPPFAASGATAEQRLRWMVDEDLAHGVEVAGLPMRLGESDAHCSALIERLAPDVLPVAGRLIAAHRLRRAEAALIEAVEEGHRVRPLDRGVPLQPLRSRLGVGADVAEWVIRTAIERGVITVADGLAATTGWQPRLTPEDHASLAAIESALRAAGREAPTAYELEAIAGSRTPALLRLLEREGRVVPVGEQRFLSPAVWREALRARRAATPEDRSYSAGEFREIFGVSRKFAIPLIEGCDRVGVCTRVGDGRRFHWDHLTPAIAAFLDSPDVDP